MTAKLALPGSQSLPRCQPWLARKFAVEASTSGALLMRSRRPLPSKSTANLIQDDGMNWVWPISPAQAPRISEGARSPRSTMRSASISSARNSSVRRQSHASVASERMVENFPVLAPKSVSSPQIATSTSPGTPYCCSMRESPEPYCFSRLDPGVRRGGIMRPENCSKLWLNTRCDLSRDSTDWSGVTPESPALIALAAMPLAAASVLNSANHDSKLPPQAAAWADDAVAMA